MLVLSRKQGEKVIVGDGYKVVVVSIRGDVVRLGFEAPREVPVYREEVHQAIQREAERATQADAPEQTEAPL